MPATKWENLAAHIRRQIESGQLQPGDQLPSTSKLKAEHKVSDSVIRFAMHSLRSEGLVTSVHGVGVFVADRRADG